MDQLLSKKKVFVIAGPCMAESEQLLQDTSGPLIELSKELGFNLIFKASFDKANRTSSGSGRGPGIATTMKWFANLKNKTQVSVLTDVHETWQCSEVAPVCDVLQIPAFLCRQTDLLKAAIESGRAVNVKKGQFLAPSGVKNIVEKAKQAAGDAGFSLQLALTERGTSFGYGDLIVDPRSFPIMAKANVPIVFDVTHSLQQPASGGASVTGGLREFAPMLTRAAIATGYVDGLFVEVHPDPKRAQSDAGTQLSIPQAQALLRQMIPMIAESRQRAAAIDELFAKHV
jgi:2-dehydro-3-deoxyphosphooctonate aldolase (KDO 8-P synthase)